MNPNLPVDRQDVADHEEDLHADAGLVCVGQDEYGQLEYVGSKKAWDKYEELANQYEHS